MVERYTSDVPAVPDPDYVYLNTERNSAVDLIDFLNFNEDNEEVPLTPDYYPRRFFEWSDAQTFIDKVGVYDEDGRLNIDLTSRSVGIPYSYDMLSDFMTRGEITGLPGSPIDEPIEIHLQLDDNENHRVTFGHEIGHYFFRVVMKQNVDGYDESEERFCTYFGAAMAMPKQYLESYEQIDEAALLDIMSRFKVSLNDAVKQLMEYGQLPPRVAIDSYIGKTKNPDYNERVNRNYICKHCADTHGDYNCPFAYTDTLLFDFTDRAWAGQLTNCLAENLHKPEILSTLTKYYIAHETQLLLFRPGAKYEYDPKQINTSTLTNSN